MKAAVWHAQRDIRIDRVQEPGRPGAGEVLLEVALCGICGTDVHEYTHGPNFLPHDEQGNAEPRILGHEFCGTILEAGPGVTRARAGDRVTVQPTTSCQQCRYCREGNTQYCATAIWVGLGTEGGGLSSRVLLKDYQVHRLPDAVTFEQAALVEPATVTWQAVSRGGVKAGDVVLVTGGGPIGQLAVLSARAAGARDVYLSEVVPTRRELAVRNVQPTRAIDPSVESVTEVLRAATDGYGADVAIEASGHPNGLKDALAATRRNGTVVQVAIIPKPVTITPNVDLTIPGKRLIGSLSYTARDYERVLQLMAEGHYPAERLITSQIPLEDVVELGLDALARPDTRDVKILVRPSA